MLHVERPFWGYSAAFHTPWGYKKETFSAASAALSALLLSQGFSAHADVVQPWHAPIVCGCSSHSSFLLLTREIFAHAREIYATKKFPLGRCVTTVLLYGTSERCISHALFVVATKKFPLGRCVTPLCCSTLPVNAHTPWGYKKEAFSAPSTALNALLLQVSRLFWSSRGMRLLFVVARKKLLHTPQYYGRCVASVGCSNPTLLRLQCNYRNPQNLCAS